MPIDDLGREVTLHPTAPHDFVTNDYGEISTEVVDYGYHMGPACRKCEMSWCMHCEPDLWSTPCD